MRFAILVGVGFAWIAPTLGFGQGRAAAIEARLRLRPEQVKLQKQAEERSRRFTQRLPSAARTRAAECVLAVRTQIAKGRAASDLLGLARRVVEPRFAHASKAQIDVLALIVLEGVQRGAKADLQRQIDAIEDLEAKQALRDKKDSISELSQEDMLMLQATMEQRSRLEQAISNIMKATAETSDDIASNIKA